MLDCTIGPDGKHIFLDDMESLLYVVLYSGLMWQPHMLDPKGLTFLIYRLFDYTSNIPGYGLHGGTPKGENLVDRSETRCIGFASSALAEWIDTMLEFRKPERGNSSMYGEEWTNVDAIDAWWTEFLRTYTLESDNRVEHTPDTACLLDPESYTPPPSPPTPHESLSPEPLVLSEPVPMTPSVPTGLPAVTAAPSSPPPLPSAVGTARKHAREFDHSSPEPSRRRSSRSARGKVESSLPLRRSARIEDQKRTRTAQGHQQEGAAERGRGRSSGVRGRIRGHQRRGSRGRK